MIAPACTLSSRDTSVLLNHLLTPSRLLSESASAGFKGVINDDNVAASSGQRPVDRCRQAKALSRGSDLELRVLDARNPRQWKHTLIPWLVHNPTEVGAMFDCQIGAIADDDQAFGRIVAKHECRKRD